MDKEESMFKDADLAIVVGANDVINPAANTAEERRFTECPYLMLMPRKTSSFATLMKSRVMPEWDNPLYSDTRAILMLGDANASLEKLLELNARK